MLLIKIIILILVVFIIGIVLYVKSMGKIYFETCFYDSKDEKQAFKNYQEAVNKMCENCEYQCEFRGKRDELKMQRIEHREIRCQKERDEYESYVIKKSYYNN